MRPAQRDEVVKEYTKTKVVDSSEFMLKKVSIYLFDENFIHIKLGTSEQ